MDTHSAPAILRYVRETVMHLSFSLSVCFYGRPDKDVLRRPAIRSCEYLIFTIRANIWGIVRLLLVQFGKDPLKVSYTDFIAFSGIFALL